MRYPDALPNYNDVYKLWFTLIPRKRNIKIQNIIIEPDFLFRPPKIFGRIVARIFVSPGPQLEF